MEEIVLVNKIESVVKQIAEQIIAESDICQCPRCLLDIVALALNTLPPKYVVTTIGNAVTGVDLASLQWQANITVAVYNAINIVKSRPRHS